jgi:hypothetical protein
MRKGAQTDFDGHELVPALASYLAHRRIPAHDRALLDQLVPWARGGALRLKPSPNATQYSHHAAVAIMDELEPRLIEAIFNPIFKAGGIGSYDGSPDSYRVLPMEWVNTPNNDGSRLGSAYDDSGWAGHELNLLKELSGRKVGEPYPASMMAHLCGPHGRASCFSAIVKAMTATYAALVKANGGSHHVASWTADTATKVAGETMPEFDAIGYRAIGLVGQPNVDWQNRPTFQQVVEFPAHRG